MNPKLTEVSKATQFNSETAKVAQKKGVEKKYENKKGAELAAAILDTPLKGDELKKLQMELGVSEELTNEAAMDAKMVKEAKEGNYQAYEKLTKKAGRYVEKSESKVQEEVNVAFAPLTQEQKIQLRKKLDY